MTPATHEEASPTFGRYAAAEEMPKYGITRVPTDYFIIRNIAIPTWMMR
jgi:hypothetical protein